MALPLQETSHMWYTLVTSSRTKLLRAQMGFLK